MILIDSQISISTSRQQPQTHCKISQLLFIIFRITEYNAENIIYHFFALTEYQESVRMKPGIARAQPKHTYIFYTIYIQYFYFCFGEQEIGEDGDDGKKKLIFFQELLQNFFFIKKKLFFFKIFFFKIFKNKILFFLNTSPCYPSFPSSLPPAPFPFPIHSSHILPQLIPTPYINY